MSPEKTGHIPTRGPSAVWVNKPESGQLPSGVTHRTFHSEAHRADVGYCIYLPPGYGSDANRRYPVIYNLHGADGNELHGFREVEVLEAGIRAERWPAMIVVMPNGGKRTFYKDSHGTNASRERQRPGAVVAWATSGTGPQAKPKAAAVGHFHGSTPPPTGEAPALPSASAVGEASPAEGSLHASTLPSTGEMPALPCASAVGDGPPAEGSHNGRFMSETLIMRELIPHIDANYRTIAAGHGRCIEGHSMGGRGATRLAMKYPRAFCSLFNLAGNVPRTLANFDPTRPDTYPNSYLGPDRQNYIDNDAFELLEKNLADIKDSLRIQLWCGTRDMDHLGTIREFHQALLAAGVDHTYLEIEGQGHNKNQMIDMYRDVWFNFHVESLRRAAQRASYGLEVHIDDK